MNQEIHTRLRWIKQYESSGNLGVTCQRCGISRPTLRKWLKRYEELGVHGLISKSRKPKVSPNRKIFEDQEQQILLLRLENNLGARRIQNELKRQHHLSLSLATIHDVLIRNKVKPLKRPKRKKKILRYSRPIPGERVQLDTCKIAPGIYQYTAIDDCTWYQVIEIYHSRIATNTILFLEKIVEEHPNPKYDVQFLLYVGAYYEYLAYHNEAIRTFEKILKEYPDSTLASLAQCAIGVIYEEKLGNADKANQIYKSVLTRFPNSLEAIWVEEKLGMKKLGMHDKQRAVIGV